MAKKYLVAVDGSDHGWKALELAADLAKLSGAELMVVHVIPYQSLTVGVREFAKTEGVPVEEEYARFLQGKAFSDEIAKDAQQRARARGLSKVTMHVTDGNPADEIIAIAKSEAADMVFLGSRGLSRLGGLLIGSVSHKVMHLASCTCVAVK